MSPAAPTAARLLAEVDRLDPDERTHQVVALARSLDPADRARLLADLGVGDAHAAGLAVTMAVAAGDAAHLAAATGSVHPGVRARALGAAALPADALAVVAEHGSLADRTRVAARLRRGGHEPLADALLPTVRRRYGDAAAAALLPGCSPPVVADGLPELAHAVRRWGALVARHPQAVTAHAVAELEGRGTERRAVWWAGAGPLLGALVRRRPDAVLDLAERLLTGPLPPALLAALHRLLAVDGSRVVALLLADPDRVAQLGRSPLGRSARTRLAALPDADLGALLRASGPSHRLLLDVLRGLAPHRRAAVHDLAHAGRDRGLDLLGDDELALLPHARRHTEARRMLALVRDDPATTLRVSAWLPFPEARPVLEAATRGADASLRATGYELLVRAAAATGDPATVTAVLTGLRRIPNEQDPVRARVLGALARVRPELVEPAALPALDALVTAAVDARDTSGATRSALHHVVFGLLGHPWPDGSAVAAWALDAADRLGAWRHDALLGPALLALPRGRERAVVARVLPRLRSALRRGEPTAVLGLVAGLGRRARDLPELQALVAEATTVRDDHVQRRAVAARLDAPGTRLARAEELVARDRSLITLPPVLAVLARHRPARVLESAGRRLRGRFGTGAAWWLPDLTARDLRRWSPRQVEAHRGLLRRALADPGTVRHRRAAVAGLLAELAPTAVDDLLADPDVLVAEAALTGLGRAADPEAGIGRLLGGIATDRARVALPAAARCARDLPPARLAVLLPGPASAATVTARKELVRWQQAFRPEGALDTLLAAWPGGHRDVRIAVLTALRPWFGDDRVAALYAQAGEGERDLALAVLAAVPGRTAPALRPRYAALVRRITAHPEPDVARAALHALGRWVPWDPGARDALHDAVTDLRTTAVWSAAAGTALRPGVWTELPALLPAIVSTLLAATGTGPAQPGSGQPTSGQPAAAEPAADAATTDPATDPPGSGGARRRDRPAGQRLDRIVAGLAARGAVARRHPGPVREVAALLAADPATLPAAARLLAVLAAPGPGLADDLTALAALVADRPVVAAAVGPALETAAWPAADALVGVDVLVAVDGPAAGLLAVAVVARVGPRTGWTGDWLQRVDALRAHPDPDVRAAADGIVTAPE
ncbi:hypothetical protein GCM10017691_16890 [Pseudonocardia petroleophila]|uniref:Uncharacterized protein n=1 Tax=Pseudonocardia petroleophila TaxID=37331 RepID=A0A7G7MHI3_9PSEU|nr:hypothetical protein [Pseudonocardia petroleophila]QNG52244.1 hypothetical protein H6H00_30115 [Pseudonocardia petroleophila]